jgi:hypothetical protein
LRIGTATIFDRCSSSASKALIIAGVTGADSLCRQVATMARNSGNALI